MPAPSTAADAAAEQARLFDEAVRLTEALRECAAAGDEAGSAELVARRDELLARAGALGATSTPGDASAREHRRRSARAIERILALDREIGQRLLAEAASLRTQLAALERSRDLLRAYHAPEARAARYTDRIG